MSSGERTELARGLPISLSHLDLPENTPVGVAIDITGAIFVSCGGDNSIVKITAMRCNLSIIKVIAHAVLSWVLVLGCSAVSNSVHAEQILRVGIPNFATSRGNPFATTSGIPPIYTYAAFLEGLTRVNNKAEALPMLAERWEYETETTWLFHLREGAMFSNGEPADAYAVAFTHGLLISEVGAAYPIAVEQRGIESIEVVDDTTVRMHTSQPDILLPNKIAALKIVPPKGIVRLKYASPQESKA